MQKLAVAFVCTLLCISLVSCAKETLKIEIHPQSNNWWIAVSYRDAAFPTRAIEVQQFGSTEWVEMRYDGNPWWKFWVYQAVNGRPFAFPLSFRLTATNGAQVTLTGAVTSLTGAAQYIDSLVQYPDNGVITPPTEQPTAPATEAPATDAPAPATEAPATDAPATEAPATDAPTAAPSAAPTDAPSAAPTDAPSAAPTDAPSAAPTDAPATEAPATAAPTGAPTGAPTAQPATASPTDAPTSAPTPNPTGAPTVRPATAAPTAQPTDAPTSAPTANPTGAPTARPATTAPTAAPTGAPTAAPTARATAGPSVAATTAPSSGCSAKTKIIVPLYVYPGAAWDTIAAGASKVKTVAIVNPASGPTATPNAAYKTYMDKLNAAGVDMIGYVYTGWGNRVMSAVKADINTYAQNWPLLKGIFLDEGAATSDKEAYYKELYDYILGMPGWTYDVINPGTPPTAGYYDAATTIVSLENYGSEGAGSTPSYASCDRKEKFSAIVHSVSSGSMSSLIDTLLSKKYFGYIYVTDGAGGCCTYNALTSYYSNMVNYIASKN